MYSIEYSITYALEKTTAPNFAIQHIAEMFAGLHYFCLNLHKSFPATFSKACSVDWNHFEIEKTNQY